MRIGIDASAIPTNRAGAGNYIFNLIAAFSKIDFANDYIIFAKSEHIEEWKIKQSNFCFLDCSFRNPPLRLAWEQAVFPYALKKHKIDLLHSPHYTMPYFASCKSVVTFCDMIFFLYPYLHTLAKRFFFRSIIKISSRKADAIIAISKSTARDINALLQIQSKKIHVTPLASGDNFRLIDDSNALGKTCHKYGLIPGNYLLFIGVLEPRKNIPMLLKAYRKLVDRGIRQKLVIVGKKGWFYNEIFSSVQSLRLEGKVIFTGFVPDEDLPSLLNGALLFVYPSLYEGFGLPVLEAMSCGTPVVTSNISSMPEIIGDAGLLVDPTNINHLAENIEKLILSNSLRNSLRHRGISRAATFSWERTARETLNVYTQIGG
jgi:glycosyltransferase involved in cell wall biosynthesis